MTQELGNILDSLGFTVTLRGTVTVKGKGIMTTYYVLSQPTAKSVSETLCV